jgi:hypothetical protein
MKQELAPMTTACVMICEIKTVAKLISESDVSSNAEVGRQPKEDSMNKYLLTLLYNNHP